jgi:hypothetical protein
VNIDPVFSNETASTASSRPVNVAIVVERTQPKHRPGVFADADKTESNFLKSPPVSSATGIAETDAPALGCFLLAEG